MQINICLYLSKGLAEFMFVANVNEFFIPQGDNWNFMDVFSSIKPKTNIERKDEKAIDMWREKEGAADGSHGWARQHAHPYCYMTVMSDCVFSDTSMDFDDTANPWLGQRYPRHLYQHLSLSLMSVTCYLQ